MEAVTLKDVLDIINAGGNVALVAGIYFGQRVISLANKFLRTHENMSKTVKESHAILIALKERLT